MSYGQSDSISHYQNLAKQHKKNIPLAIEYLNKAMEISIQNKQDSLYLNSISRKSTLFGNSKDYKNAIEQATFLNVEANQLNDIFHIARSHDKLGRYYSKTGDLTLAVSNYLQAIRPYKTIKDSLKLSYVFEKIANIQNDLGDFLGAEKSALEGLKYAKHNPKGNSAWLYNCLGRASKEQFQFDEALSWYDRGISSTNNQKIIVSLIQNQAVVLMKQQKYNEARKLLTALLQESEVKNSTYLTSRILDNLGYANFKIGEPNALTELLEAYALRQKDDDKTGLFASTIHLTEYYQAKDREKSLEFAKDAFNLSKIINSPEAQIEALSYLIALETPENTKLAALSSLHLRDSIAIATSKQRTEYLKFKYKTDEISLENSLLLTEKAQQETIIAEEKIKKYIIGFISFILFITIIALYYILRERYKKQRLKERIATQQHFSKRIHDELASDIFNIMAQMEQANIPVDYVDALENIYERTRDINRETISIITNEDFSTTLSNLIEGYLSENERLILNGINEVDWTKISEENKQHLKRILQELMTNMKKHSKASLVAISFKERQTSLQINYADNGIGVILNDQNKGHGMANMENRIISINGTCIFESEPNNGFTCVWTIPLK
ncbi:hypothetical protein ULMS_01240 [Patiriisocius marinistellae]|uniref:histidine kinase n=2 Tax=Patiriisocius marinistellae TaxID=2494560 RepID=A0A5J4FWX8_9FLAO|nr:hypothetical protein ULMS_01240 [Patiriisocius marinistellae]